MAVIHPNGHEELHVSCGCFIIQKHPKEEDCGKGELYAWHYAKNMTFNDEYITFTDENGTGNMIPLKGWILSVIPKDIVLSKDKQKKLPEREQMTIFDFL